MLQVRKCCITNIAPRRDVAPILILKTRDVDVNVRLAAFKKALDYPKHFKVNSIIFFCIS